MMLKTVLLIIWFEFSANAQETVHPVNPDVGLNEKQLIVKYGYPAETHAVKTEDGYILRMFRIPSGKNHTDTRKKLPVLLIPGLLASSSAWVLMGSEKGLGFLLADRGYDVWLGNFRGTTWSRKHETLSPKRNRKEFWDFSFQEMGYYDIPALVDYILNTTKQHNLYYIGHSQGSTSFFALASTRPEYNKKIRLMIGLSPVIYTEHMDSIIIRMIAIYIKQIQAIMDSYKIYEILAYAPLYTVLSQMFCNDDSPLQGLCAGVFYYIAGYTTHFNSSLIPVITSTIPAGASMRQFLHFTQIRIAKQFQHYDYGEADNMIKYDQPEPPKYDLSKVTAPVALYYSDSDTINSVVDVDRAASELPNVVKKKLISGFNHVDFTWATDVVPVLYNDVFQLMKKYESL